jgi:hypothetical protein
LSLAAAAAPSRGVKSKSMKSVMSAPAHVQSHCHAPLESQHRDNALGLGVPGPHNRQHALPARDPTSHLPSSVRSHRLHDRRRKEAHDRTHDAFSLGW